MQSRSSRAVLQALCIALLVGLGLLVAACGSGSESSSGDGQLPNASQPAPAPSRTGPPEPEPTEPLQPTQPPQTDRARLQQFTERCPNPNTYSTGQVVYPASLTARVDQTITYGAAVDIRANPAPPSVVIPGPDPTSEPVEVQCMVAARLVALGSGIVVEDIDATEDGGWRRQQFTPNGVLEWSWSVTPREPRPQQVRLELRPAIQVGKSTESVLGRTQASYVTKVEVETTWIERLSEWFETQWPLLAGITTIVAGAVTGLLIFSKDTRDKLGEFLSRRRGGGGSGTAGG